MNELTAIQRQVRELQIAQARSQQNVIFLRQAASTSAATAATTKSVVKAYLQAATIASGDAGLWMETDLASPADISQGSALIASTTGIEVQADGLYRVVFHLHTEDGAANRNMSGGIGINGNPVSEICGTVPTFTYYLTFTRYATAELSTILSLTAGDVVRPFVRNETANNLGYVAESFITVEEL